MPNLDQAKRTAPRDDAQRLLDTAARGDVHEAIRQGLEESERQEGLDIDDFFIEFELKHRLSRWGW